MAVSANRLRGAEVEDCTAVGRPLRSVEMEYRSCLALRQFGIRIFQGVRIRRCNSDRDTDECAELPGLTIAGLARPHLRIRSLPRPDSAVCHWPTLSARNSASSHSRRR